MIAFEQLTNAQQFDVLDVIEALEALFNDKRDDCCLDSASERRYVAELAAMRLFELNLIGERSTNDLRERKEQNDDE